MHGKVWGWYVVPCSIVVLTGGATEGWLVANHSFQCPPTTLPPSPPPLDHSLIILNGEMIVIGLTVVHSYDHDSKIVLSSNSLIILVSYSC